jgi:hypothetical protein
MQVQGPSPWIEWPCPRGTEIHRLPLTGGIDGGDTAIALDDVAHSGGIGVPVKLAQRAGLEQTPANFSETGKPVTLASLAVPPLNCSVFCAPRA